MLQAVLNLLKIMIKLKIFLICLLLSALTAFESKSSAQFQAGQYQLRSKYNWIGRNGQYQLEAFDRFLKTIEAKDALLFNYLSGELEKKNKEIEKLEADLEQKQILIDYYSGKKKSNN